MTQDQINQAELQNPQNYYLRIFYFSRKDTRFLVPKRRGYGYTFNFARNPHLVLALVGAILAGWAAIVVAVLIGK